MRLSQHYWHSTSTVTSSHIVEIKAKFVDNTGNSLQADTVSCHVQLRCIVSLNICSISDLTKHIKIDSTGLLYLSLDTVLFDRCRRSLDKQIFSTYGDLSPQHVYT